MITLSATAKDPDGSITKVDFFQGTSLIATVTSKPYTFTLNNVQGGNHSFTAVATDNRGEATTSSSVTITVVPDIPPTISLTTNGATFKAPASVTLTASANDVDGNVAKVDFFQGNTPIATITPPAPFNFTVNNLAQGSYTFTAIATDDQGATTTSNQATITVTPATAQVYYIFTDQLNMPRAITNQQNQVVWRWDNNDPFGANIPDDDPSNTGNHFTFNPRFPGQYFDRETNLAYNLFRDYDPSIGRYIESDPIGLRGGVNTYSYVLSDPTSSFDPNGLEVRLVCRPLAGALGATGQQHCFVFVSCPAEGWSRILSLFATNASATRGQKSLADPDTPTRRDDPGAPGNTGIPVTPAKPGCDSCAYEKDVMNRFLAFPSGDVPYFMLGPNSNSFAQYLITSPTFGAGLPPSAPSNAPGFGFGWPGFGLQSR